MTSFPACVGCNKPFKYKGPEPNLLPCLHAVCSNCLEANVNSLVTCSVCHRSHDRSSQIFPVDQVVLAEVLHLTLEQEPSQISCTNKEDGNQAACWCEECSDFLCEHCHISHAEIKATRSHTIWEISNVCKTLKGTETRCSKHGMFMNIYDKDCGLFICCQCFFADHPNHNTVTSEEFAKLEDQNLNKNLRSVTVKKGLVCQSTAVVDGHAKAVEETASRLRETVGHTFSELRSLLGQREKLVLVELEQLIDCMRTSNHNRRPLLKSIDTSCQTTIDYINKCLQYTSPQHFLQLKSYIDEATQFCSSADVPQVHKDESSVDFFKQGLQDIRSAISSFGTFLVPISQTGHPDENTQFQSEKLTSLEKTIENLSSQIAKMAKTSTTWKGMVTRRGDEIKRLKETNGRLQNILCQILPDGLTTSDSFLHIIQTSTDNKMFVVKCPKMTFSHERINVNRVHIDTEGALVGGGNRNTVNPCQLKNYCGATASSPLPSSGLMYWEVEANVDIGRNVPNGRLIFEVGVCDEAVMDESHYVADQNSSCSLYFSWGSENNSDKILIHLKSGITRGVIHQIQQPKSGRGLRIILGVLYDGGAQKVTFFHSTDMAILGSGYIPALVSPASSWLDPGLWKVSKIRPVFAIFSSTIRIKLISGLDINMSPKTKQVLHEALSG